ncbi:MAG: type I phosphomannose isomerase catalytic subunit [Oscillospiraceae bacterium]
MLPEPLLMEPAYKDYLWGGDTLVNEFHKNTSLRPLAESWEVSCHPDGPSIVKEGQFAGMTLANVLAQHPAWLGEKSLSHSEFPVLIKLIDAKDNLSLQVHPDDAYARKHEGQQGKNEMWYVVEAQPGAELILGFQQKIDREKLELRIRDNTILEVVNSVPVHTGDCFEIPAGMLHAIGAGVVIAEVQQSSNVTYRVYDYDRRGPDGKARQLHVAQALDVTDTALKAVPVPRENDLTSGGLFREQLTNWKWFRANKLDCREKGSFTVTTESFQTLTVLDGSCALTAGDRTLSLQRGDSIFLPADLGEVQLTGTASLLNVSL